MYQLPEDTKITFVDRNGYLYAEVTGPHDSFEITMAYWMAIAEQCRLRNTRNLLVHERLGLYAGKRDMELTVDSIIALGFGKTRLAFVDAYVDDTVVQELGGILAMERGYEARMFGTLAEADRWLRLGSNDRFDSE